MATHLGRYRIVERIAVGGMAEVYRATTVDRSGRAIPVAIKRVLPQLAADDAFVQMLLDEAQLASTLKHPNIAQVLDFGHAHGEHFIAMEFVNGKDLGAVIDRSRERGLQLAPQHGAYVMMRALEALHAAHQQCDAQGQPLSIVHRDVSPSNVILSYNGEVKLCDFGIAKAKMCRAQTRAGVIKGKVRYMSPEQACGQSLDRRSDIFSAATVLYELLTGEVPFGAKNEMELLFRVREAQAVAPSQLNPEVPQVLDRIISHGLGRKPEQRYATAAEFGAELRRFIEVSTPAFTPVELEYLLWHLFADEVRSPIEHGGVREPSPDDKTEIRAAPRLDLHRSPTRILTRARAREQRKRPG